MHTFLVLSGFFSMLLAPCLVTLHVLEVPLLRLGRTRPDAALLEADTAVHSSISDPRHGRLILKPIPPTCRAAIYPNPLDIAHIH